MVYLINVPTPKGHKGGIMQKDFHYDVIYTLAKEAGYKNDEAYVIAYSSQYVDDNTDREYSVFDFGFRYYFTLLNGWYLAKKDFTG